MACKQGEGCAGSEDVGILSWRRRRVRIVQIICFAYIDPEFRQDPLVQYEFQEIKAAINYDRTVVSRIGWKQYIMNKGNLKRMRILIPIAFFSQWSGNGLVSFYLNKVFNAIGITDPTTQLLINGILQIWNMAWALGASFLCERIGRRVLFISSTIGMLVFFTLQTACSAVYANTQNEHAAHAVIAFIFLFYAAYE